jgi:replicative DNA helicase
MTVLKSLNDYGVGFQIKVISSLLRHKEFLQNIHDVLNPDEFDNQAHKWIVKEVLNYYSKYHTNPTAEYISIEMKKMDNDVLKVAVADQLKEAFKAIYDDVEYVETEFSNFCKNQQIKKALLNSVGYMDKGDYESIRFVMLEALKAGQEKTMGHEYEKDIETRYREEERSAIPTEWAHVNQLLMGGLGKGDLGLVFGNPGGGKSWMLVNIGAAAVKAGYNVCHYTLELSEYYVGKRYDAVFTGIDVQNIANHRKTVEESVAQLQGKLVIKEFPMGKTSASSIETHIQKCRDLGNNPDLVIIDYIDLLRAKHRSQDRKDEIDDVYTAVKGMARELKIPIWSVSQVNRMGAKDDVIEGDKAAGSYNKMMISDFAMSLSRKRQDKVNGTGRIHIMKNRYGMDGMTYQAKLNTSNGHIEISSSEMAEDELNTEQQSPQYPMNSFTSEQKQKMFELFRQTKG